LTSAYEALGRKRLERMLAAAERKSERAADARRALPPGSSRARVTTANARWARAAEERERIVIALSALATETNNGGAA
jgi:hypothetical protein